jgi:hypothetical protein
MPPRTPNSPPPQGGEGEDFLEKGEEIIGDPIVPEETVAELQARIRRLEAALAHSDEQRAKSEEDASRLSAQAQSSVFTTNVTERFARKSDTGEDLWWYRIDLAPCGGIDIRVNGVQYVHGETYLFNTNLLRSVKEIISRTWGHEANIHGENENVYKRAQDRVLRGASRR